MAENDPILPTVLPSFGPQSFDLVFAEIPGNTQIKFLPKISEDQTFTS